jgi:hypothetical protein
LVDEILSCRGVRREKGRRRCAKTNQEKEVFSQASQLRCIQHSTCPQRMCIDHLGGRESGAGERSEGINWVLGEESHYLDTT